jgi:drug/metabolite transporter (DMT)-like permease
MSSETSSASLDATPQAPASFEPGSFETESFEKEAPPSKAEPSATSHWQADACLLTTAIIWGVNIPVVKFATLAVDAIVFNAIRMLFSVAALAVLAWFESRHRTVDWKKVPWLRVILFSIFSGVIYQTLFMLGIKRTTAANTSLLMASMPMWTAMLSLIFFSERLPRITWIGLLVTFAGTATVVGASGDVQFGREFLIGNLLILAASMAWAGVTVISRPLMRSISPLQLAFLSCALSTPIQLLVASPRIPENIQGLLLPQVIACLLFSGGLSTGLAPATWNFGVKRLGGSHAAVYQNVVTLVAVLGGWWVLAEPQLLAQWIGGGLTIAGLFIMRRGRTILPQIHDK